MLTLPSAPPPPVAKAKLELTLDGSGGTVSLTRVDPSGATTTLFIAPLPKTADRSTSTLPFTARSPRARTAGGGGGGGGDVGADAVVGAASAESAVESFDVVLRLDARNYSVTVTPSYPASSSATATSLGSATHASGGAAAAAGNGLHGAALRDYVSNNDRGVGVTVLSIAASGIQGDVAVAVQSRLLPGEDPLRPVAKLAEP